MKKFGQGSQKTTLLLITILAIAAIALSNVFLNPFRFDLTEHKLYTVTDGTKNILRTIESPLTIHYFFSEDLSKATPQLRLYQQRVYDLLHEYQRIAGPDKLIIQKLNPEPFSEAEDLADSYGVKAVPIASGFEMYFGLAITNDYDGQETIPFLHPNRENYLEYDLSQIIFRLGTTQTYKVGLLTSLPLAGSFDHHSMQPSNPWISYQQLDALVEIETIEPNATELPQDINLLLLLHPQDLSEKLTYAVDQYVLSGKNTLIVLDPLSEQTRQSNLAQLGNANSSDLPKLLKAWGVDYNPDQILADYGLAETVTGNDQRPIQHLGIQRLHPDTFASNEIYLKDIERILLTSTGALKPAENASTTFTPIFQSSTEAMLMDRSKFQFLFDPAELYRDFSATGEKYTLMARVQGSANSAFAKAPKGIKATHLKHTKTDHGIEVTIIADSDFLADGMWVQIIPFFGQKIPKAFADNGNFFTNLVDHMLGNSDLMNIRGRGQFARPFTRVETLRKQAEKKFQDKQHQLEQELTEVQQKLTALQQRQSAALTADLPQEQDASDTIEAPLDITEEGGSTDDASAKIDLAENAAQMAAIEDQFTQDLLNIRKALRDVKHQMDLDIKRLGTHLKLINILGVPLLLTLLLLIGYIVKRRK